MNTHAISFHFTSLHPISVQSCLAIFSHILDLQNGCILKIFPHNVAVAWLEMLLYAYNVLPVHSTSTAGSWQIAFTFLFLPSGCSDKIRIEIGHATSVFFFNLQSCCPSLLLQMKNHSYRSVPPLNILHVCFNCLNTTSKVGFPLCTLWKHIWGRRGVASLIFNLSTKWKQVVNFVPQLLYRPERTPVLI